MPTAATQSNAPTDTKGIASRWGMEALAIVALLAMAAYFLAISWRKWPDPIADSGLQWYGFWRLSHGALLYHDVVWNYGPLSAYFNTLLFKCFGPGMMVLATANLIIYAVILSLAYFEFRKAWGRLGAFAATGVFISVFSFSHLCAIANYNFVTPYAHESAHGMLLVLVTALIAVKWRRAPSMMLSFLFGLCGGLSAVLKPEFMLAAGILGMAALVLRWVQKKRITITECLLIAAGVVLPTLFFAAWFARSESWNAAFIDASQAWMMLFDHTQAASSQQQVFLGFNKPWNAALIELQSALYGTVAVAMIWAAGWFVNRTWSTLVRVSVALAAGAIVCFIKIESGWFHVGHCFPAMLFAIIMIFAWRLRREIKESGQAMESTIMAFALALLAGAMLARMPLQARVYHLGFFQAALAGMTIVAFIVADVPRWTGSGKWGRCVSTAGCLLLVAVGCASIAIKSHEIRADQTQPVGSGPDRFYAAAPEVNETGWLVNWTVERMEATPPDSTLFVLPEGFMINYLSRRASSIGSYRTEEQLLSSLQKAPPDYVVFITRDLSDFGVKNYGRLGGPGYDIVKWVADNYSIEAMRGGDPFDPNAKRGSYLLHRKPNVAAATASAAK